MTILMFAISCLNALKIWKTFYLPNDQLLFDLELDLTHKLQLV